MTPLSWLSFCDLSQVNTYLPLEELRNTFEGAAQDGGLTYHHLLTCAPDEPIGYLHLPHTAAHPLRVMLYGGEDASEPIFSQTLSVLVRHLTTPGHPLRELPVEWLIIDCIHPVGYRRNAGWHQHPGDLQAFWQHSWEDPHGDMLFWNSAPRPEVRALHTLFEQFQPEVLFNLHDESHFPAGGYQMAFSRAFERPLWEAHLARVAEDMDLSEELILTETYGDASEFSVAPALRTGTERLTLNETCGYRRRAQSQDPEPPADITHLLKTYLAHLQQDSSTHLASARYHTELLLQEQAAGRPFNSKMWALTGHALPHLKPHRDLDTLARAFQEHMRHWEQAYAPVPVRAQVKTQLDFIFTTLEQAIQERSAESTRNA